MKSVREIDPRRCKMWELHDRIHEWITVDSCRDEIRSFEEHGQLIPVLGRSCADEDYDVELIYGARRLFVARHLNVPLKVELRELSDQEAIVAMRIENCRRSPISPYEQGRAYSRWLSHGLFKSQEELAESLSVSRASVSRLLKVAKLPAAVVDAFGSGTDIRGTWGIELMQALEDPERKAGILKQARQIARESNGCRPRPEEVYRRLALASSAGSKVKQFRHDVVAKGVRGEPLFRIRQQRDSIAIILPKDRLSDRALGDVRRELKAILRGPS